MTKTLNEINLEDLLPDCLKNDPDVLAIAQAATPEFQEISNLINMLDPTQDILNFLSEENQHTYLDLIAWEKHVDFYDSSLSLNKKKELVNNSRYFHRHKGTPAAVEDLIATVFGDGKVVEWFEYGAPPGYFKVVTSNTSVTEELADQFVHALDSVKRKSAVLETVEITRVDDMNLYFAGIAHIGDKFTLK